MESDGVQSVACPSCGSNVYLLPDTQTLRHAPPTALGHFQLLEAVGQGHYGVVWKARDTQLKRTVALKIPRLEVTEASVEVYLREARTAAQLRHPHIVPVHAVETVDGRPFIVSDFIEGVSLADYLLHQKMSPQRAAELCLTLADALEHAHQQGVIHRDLKPGNVLLDRDGIPFLTDFGLAKNVGETISVTVAGQVLGTPAYMSPEQARGDAHLADARSDVYSLGVILYELLAGQRPFRGGSRLLVYQVQHDDPQPPSRSVPSVPRDLETICLKAMSKEPSKRYASAAEMAADLRRYLRHEPILARPISRLERLVRWTRRNRTIAMLLGAILFLGLSLSGLAAYSISTAPPPPPSYPVTLTTEPTGATVVFMRRDPATGRPLPIPPVTANNSPVQVSLPAGDYFVSAYLPDDSEVFHEVYRHVPEPDETKPNVFAHSRWRRLEDGTIELPRVRLWRTSEVTGNMVYFSGSPRFQMGDSSLPSAPPHWRSISAYWLDAREVTVGDYRQRKLSLSKNLAAQSPPDEQVLTHVSRQDAIAYAESIGKILMSEAQYEFAATNGGTTRFPWGDTPPAEGYRTIGPAGVPDYDRTKTMPPVQGLFSNALELVDDWNTPYPANRGAMPPGDPLTLFNVVRGGALASNDGDSALVTPRFRAAIEPRHAKPGIGFRCARMARVRMSSADFSAP